MGFIAKSKVCFDVDIMFYQLFTDKDIYMNKINAVMYNVL